LLNNRNNMCPNSKEPMMEPIFPDAQMNALNATTASRVGGIAFGDHMGDRATFHLK